METNKNSAETIIAYQRKNQIDSGYTKENDLKYNNNELSHSAVTYLLSNHKTEWVQDIGHRLWFFDWEFFKPTPEDRLKELSKAGALIHAEIDRLLNTPIKINIEKTDTGYSCYCNEIPGIYTIGDTIEEMKDNLKSVIEDQIDYFTETNNYNRFLLMNNNIEYVEILS